MWEQLLPAMVGGTLIDHDVPSEPTKIVGYELTPDRVVIKGDDFTFGGAREYMGINAGHEEGTFLVRGYGIAATVRMP